MSIVGQEYSHAENERLRGQLREMEESRRRLTLLAADAQDRYERLLDRLRLTSEERVVVAGGADGCIRVNDLRLVLRRILGGDTVQQQRGTA